MSPRPVAAFVLGLIGGIFLVLNAGIELVLFWAWGGGIWLPWFYLVIATLTLVFGILVIVGSAAMLARPSHHVAWGIVVLVFSLVSIIGLFAFSLFAIVGVVLGSVGGGLGIGWRPYAWYGYGAPMTYPMWASTFPGPPPVGGCPRCGAAAVPGFPVCTQCGTRL